jgi:hypothetical protein
LTFGGFIVAISAFIKNPFFSWTTPFHSNSTPFVHRKLWANLIRPQLSVAKQRSPNFNSASAMTTTLIPSLLSCMIALSLVSCASLKTDDAEDIYTHELKDPFTHGAVTISGWDEPPIHDGQLVASTRLHLKSNGEAKPRVVRLSAGDSYQGLKLARVDGRGDTIGEASKGLAAVITTDISLKLEPPSPKKYLILRDISGYAMAFYSDIPHPPLR